MPWRAQNSAARAGVRAVPATNRITSLAWTHATRCWPQPPRPTIAASIIDGRGLSVRLDGIRRRLGALVHGVVAQHRCDAQAVRIEDPGAAFCLRLAVALEVAPLAHRLLVAPELERHELPPGGDALEALERDEAVGLFEVGLERAHQVHVLGEPAFGRREFEDHRDHWLPPCRMIRCT